MDRQPGKYERLYLERQERDLALAAREGGHPKGFWFDIEAGDRVVQFIEVYCRHYEGEWAGQPMLLEEWQKQLVRIIFGWMRADGTRRFRTAYVEIPRKNGKSFWCSALSVYLMVGDGEPGPQIYSFATMEEQAAIVWHGAVAMVEQSPGLQKFIKIHGQKKKTGGMMFCDRVRGRFRPLGADSHTKDGLSPHGCVADELHEHRDRRVWTKLRTATGARRQPLQIEITTAGVYDPESIGWQEHKYAEDVLEGTIQDESFFAFIAAMDEKDDPFSVETQKKANPNYGVSAKAAMLEDAANLARNSPSFYNDYIRYHLNGWVQQDKRWLSPEDWKKCDPVSPEVALEIREEREKRLVGKRCWGGLDLAQTRDLNAFVLVVPLEDGLIELVCRFYLPEMTARAAEKIGKNHFMLWADAGWIQLTPGTVTDYDFIRRDINILRETGFSIEEIAFDKFGAGDLTTKLGDGDGFTMVDFSQGFLAMNAPCREWERRTIAGTFRHGGNPVLAYNVNNAVAVYDANGNVKISKDPRKKKGPIDGLAAGLNGLGRVIVAPSAGSGSYLADEPLISF